MISPLLEKSIVGLCVLFTCYLAYDRTKHTSNPALYLACVVTIVHLLAHEVLVPNLRKLLA